MHALCCCRSVGKSLERATADRVLSSLLGAQERCFREPSSEELEALTLEGCKSRVLELLHTGKGADDSIITTCFYTWDITTV